MLLPCAAASCYCPVLLPVKLHRSITISPILDVIPQATCAFLVRNRRSPSLVPWVRIQGVISKCPGIPSVCINECLTRAPARSHFLEWWNPAPRGIGPGDNTGLGEICWQRRWGWGSLTDACARRGSTSFLSRPVTCSLDMNHCPRTLQPGISSRGLFLNCYKSVYSLVVMSMWQVLQLPTFSISFLCRQQLFRVHFMLSSNTDSAPFNLCPN